MYRNLLLAFTVLFLMPIVALAQDGKVRGLVKDKESGEPLIGANVLVEGTNIGAATDVNGEYIILSIPPGVYTLRASLIGYAPLTVSNIRISSNLTTTQDFELLSAAVQVTGVEVVAERPLIQRNTTNTVRFTTQEDIKNLPFRGLQGIVALQAGVVDQNGQLYVRGGRQGEIAYYVDGAGTTNPIFNNATVGVIQEAIEEIQLQAGGYTAEFGGSNSGVLRTTIRSGGATFKGSLDIQTDDFAKPGNQFLGTSAFGFRNVVATIGGPILPELRFFLAGQHNYMRNRQVRHVTPFLFDNLVTNAGDPLPGPVFVAENHIPNNWVESNLFQGTLLYDISPVKFRLSGSYQMDKMPIDGGAAGGVRGGNIGGAVISDGAGGWPNYLTNFFSQRRKRMDRTNSGFGSLRASHVLGSSTFYEVSVSYQQRSFSREDPDFGQDWMSYVDSAANAARGYTGFRGYYRGPQAYTVLGDFDFAHENTPNNTFSKNEQSAFGATADITTQLDRNWELKAGGRFDTWTTRSYSVGNIAAAMTFLNGPDGKTPQSFTSAEQRRVLLSQRGVINHYGYDVDGNKVTGDGVDAPRKPFFASAYLQNKLEFQDLVLNFGLRFEHFDSKNKTFADPLAPYDSLFNQTLDVIREDKLVDQEAVSYVLPRISFSFPVTANTVFYAMYGLYAQMPSLNQLYVGNTTLSRTVSINTRGNAFLTPVGLLLRPERTTQYEVGFRQAISDNLALTLTGFHKDLKDQIGVRPFLNAAGNRIFYAYLNEDFGTVKGLELTLDLRRTNRLSARFNYTLSDAQGTGSNPRSGWGSVEQNIGRPSNFINPLDHNQTHRGSVLIDYRFDTDDGGPVLSGLGIYALLTFNSGHNYTKVKDNFEGQFSTFNVGTITITDPRSSFPTEPVNASKTPWVSNLDLSINKLIPIGPVNLDIYVNILNVLDAKQIVNVYPTTGSAEDDGWLNTPSGIALAQANPLYAPFYRAINLDNRWHYANATGNDVYGSPRQIRVGARLEF
jgi:outer membrane receptor protein involved in Fe transport